LISEAPDDRKAHQMEHIKDKGFTGYLVRQDVVSDSVTRDRAAAKVKTAQ